MARIERNDRNLGGPVAPAKVGRATETKKEGVQKPQGVGLAHSTLRTGEPFSRGEQPLRLRI
jgi:hypothetical protein